MSGSFHEYQVMMRNDEIKVTETAYHRNGVSGEGFYIITFKWKPEGEKPRNMVAVLFDEPGQCAVQDIDETAKGNITFGQGNSWRGDDFEPAMRKAIVKYGEELDKRLELIVEKGAGTK